MSIRASQPGKTAPKFLYDLVRFDPSVASPNHNVLVDHAPQFDGSRQPPSILAKGSCKHEYLSKPSQCVLPQLDQRPEQSTVWKVAAVCKRCRVHLNVFVQYPPHGCQEPCPNREFPLHHFRHASSPSPVEYHFVCSSALCQATAAVSYAPPVLTGDDVRLLTDENNLTTRYQRVLSEDPPRKDVRPATPSDALFRLKRYVTDSLNPEATKRSFPAYNKKFMEAFGTDCNDFLHSLGFKYDDEEGTWTLPQTSANIDPLHPDVERVKLENLTIELQIMIDQYCLSHATANPSPHPPWKDAKADLERVLSSQAYDRVPSRRPASYEDDHPYYASLGALGDFSDQLLVFSYDRQTECDPEEGPYYFDCLQDLANGRQSDYLTMKATTLMSQDVFGKKDIAQAYKTLGVEPEHANTATEQHIIGLYRSRLSDTGSSGQGDLKIALKRLANVRGSQAMLDAALDTVDNYEQALSWLGAEESYSDDVITALYATKVDDNKENMDTAKRAVHLIAEARNSESLRSWLHTGELNAATMNIDEACRHLNIELDQVDPSMLDILFESARFDRPGTTTDQAIEAVRKAFEEKQATTAHSPETWPVGLISHGNTCYLNSLLQYYFTIKPLRDLVLQFDQYKFDLQSHGSKVERVGNLHRPAYEIESFQSLTDDLKHLFERMIKDRGPAVRPEADLVCRAFLKPVSPDADISGALKPDSVDVNMTPDESSGRPGGEATDAKMSEKSPSGSMASSATLQGSLNGGDARATEGLVLPPSPPASPLQKPDDAQLAPPLPPRRPATPQNQPKTNLEKAEEAARQQQDVAEVMEELLTRLRASIKPLGQDSQGEQLDQLRDIFNVRIMDTSLIAGEEATTKEGDFTNIMLLPPYEPTDIYSALDRVLDIHPEPGTKKPVELYKTLQTFPPVLQISINRILMGREGKPVKSEHRIRLEETLYMDRYSEDPNVLSRRQESWQWKKQLHILQTEKEILSKTPFGLDGPSALEGLSEYLSTISEANEELDTAGIEPLNVPQELPIDLSQEAGFQRARLSVIEKQSEELQSKISSQFAGFEKLKYHLHAVFFHRGSTGHGHYWTYINDFRNNMWRQYNDEKVEECTKLEDILNAETWQQGTPTYAVYVRDDVKEQYVEPLCRNVEEVQEIVDQPMPDAVETMPDSSQTIQGGDDPSERKKEDWEYLAEAPPSPTPLIPGNSLVNRNIGTTTGTGNNPKTIAYRTETSSSTPSAGVLKKSERGLKRHSPEALKGPGVKMRRTYSRKKP